jgi:tetratricopeptide (TPR) repeat protein
LFQASGAAGDEAAALQAIQQAVRETPEKAEAWNLYYAFAYQSGHLDAIRGNVDAASAADPDGKRLPVPIAILGLARKAGKARWSDYARMMDAYAAQSIENDPPPAQLQTLAWTADELSGMVREAPDMPARPQALIHLAGVYASLGANELAAVQASEAYPDLPNTERAAAAHFLAQMHSQKGDFPKALEYVNDALRLSPQDINVWMTSAGILAAAGQRDGALQRYQQILRQFRDLPQESRQEIDKAMSALRNPL